MHKDGADPKEHEQQSKNAWPRRKHVNLTALTAAGVAVCCLGSNKRRSANVKSVPAAHQTSIFPQPICFLDDAPHSEAQE